nr:hypothetical protein [Geobacillus thermoleovorans]
MPDEGESLPCQGGLIGFISYDAVRYMERLPVLAQDDLRLPLMYFFLFDDVAIYDHQTEQLHLLAYANEGEESEANRRLARHARCGSRIGMKRWSGRLLPRQLRRLFQ